MSVLNIATVLVLCLFQVACPSSKPREEEAKSEAPKPAIRAHRPDFEIRRDGFSFGNYGNKPGVQNLTSATLQEVCGESACATGKGRTCQLSGSMLSFLDAMNRSMAGGHCDGMAVLAQAIHMGRIPLQKYSTNARATFDLPFSNTTLQSDIAKFFATQSIDPARSAEIRVSPLQVLSLIKQQEDSYTLGLYNPDNSNGHSVTAVKVIDDDARFSRIQIYDNNYPGEWQYIEVDKSNNTWDYEDYVTGDARTKTLTLIPLSSRFSPQHCPPMGDDDDSYEYEDDDVYDNDNNDEEDDDYYRNKHHLKRHNLKDNDKSSWNVWLDGPGHLEVEPGTKSFPRRSSTFDEKPIAPVYEIDARKDNLIVVTGTQAEEKEHTNIVMFRQGQSLTIEGITLSKNQKDTIKLPKDGSSLEYSTKEDESVTIRVGQTYKGADYEIKIRPLAQKGGYSLAIDNIVDPKDGSHELLLRLTSPAKKQSSFGLEMLRIAENTDSFESNDHQLLTVDRNETLHIKYGKWIQDKQPLLILSDKNNDGKINQVKQIKDEN